MSWVHLILAIIFETFAKKKKKMSNGFSVLMPSIGTVIGYVLCFFFLSYALKTIDMSVAYAIWCALGILLISIIGMVFFHESISFLKIASILLIILGTVGLRLAIPAAEPAAKRAQVQKPVLIVPAPDRCVLPGRQHSVPLPRRQLVPIVMGLAR